MPAGRGALKLEFEFGDSQGLAGDNADTAEIGAEHEVLSAAAGASVRRAIGEAIHGHHVLALHSCALADAVDARYKKKKLVVMRDTPPHPS